MLIIDGVKYEAWIPPNEEELENIVKEHAKDIFGEQSIYLDRKQKLKSLSGVGSIPDGYVITFGDSPEWYIVEVELSSHPLYEHIVSQISKFINGISNPNIQRGVVNAIDSEIIRDDFLRLRLRKAVEPTEIYKFLSDLISKQPILTIIIEKDTEELREALTTLRYPQIKVVEFQTFVREGLGLAVHSHVFEPLCRVVPPKVPVVSDRGGLTPAPTSQDTLEVIIRNPSNIRFHTLDVPKTHRRFFPGYKITFELETDIDIIQTWVSSAPAGTEVGDPDKGTYIQANLAEWYRQHPTLKVGDKVTFKVIERMKKYRLEIVKEQKEGGWRPIRLSEDKVVN